MIVDRKLIDSLIDRARRAPRLRANHNFHADAAAPAQRLLIAIEPGSYVVPHRHHAPDKQETLIVLRGSLGVVLFDAAGRVERSLVLRPDDEILGIDLPAGTYHTALALETGTVFFEAKAGPYVPLTDVERAPWAPAEGDPEVPAYLSRLRLGLASAV